MKWTDIEPIKSGLQRSFEENANSAVGMQLCKFAGWLCRL